MEVSVGQKKELLIPPIWGCCGPTGGSIFTPGQKNHPAFSEIAAKTHSPFGLYLAGHFACIPPALEKGWMVFLPRGKNRTSSRSTTTPDRWYQKFFFFGQLTLPMMCDIMSGLRTFLFLTQQFYLYLHTYLHLSRLFCWARSSVIYE